MLWRIEWFAEQQRGQIAVCWETTRHGDLFWWIAVSRRPTLHCIHHSRFTSRVTDGTNSARHIISSFIYYRWPNNFCTVSSDMTLFIVEYSCNHSRNNRTLFGAKVGIDAANHASIYPPAMARQRNSSRPRSSLAVSLNWLPSAWYDQTWRLWICITSAPSILLGEVELEHGNEFHWEGSFLVISWFSFTKLLFNKVQNFCFLPFCL